MKERQITPGLQYVRISLLIIILLMFILDSIMLFASDWSQFRGDEYRSGTTANSISTLGLKWQSTLGGSYDSVGYSSLVSLAINNHVYMYTCTPGGVLTAFDSTQNGTTIWTHVLRGKIVTALAAGNCANATNGKAIFVASNDGYLGAYDAITGSTVWEVKTGQIIYSTPLYYNEANSNYFAVSTNSGMVYKLNADNGTIIWQVNSSNGAAILSGLTYIPPSQGNTGNLCFGTEAGKIYSISSVNGGALWTTNTHNSIRSPGAYYNGNIFYISYSGILYALNTASGSIHDTC